MGQEGNAGLIDKVYCCGIPFLKVTEQHQAAIAAGKPERSIYVEGRGAETFAVCVAQFRTGGTLGLVGGLRVLGSSRKAIMERLAILKAKNITPYDLDSGNTDRAELLNTALGMIHGAKALREDPRQPRRIGRKGGVAKGIAAQAKRNAVMAEDIVRRMYAHPKLTPEDCAGILGEGWSASTLRRKYGEN